MKHRTARLLIVAISIALLLPVTCAADSHTDDPLPPDGGQPPAATTAQQEGNLVTNASFEEVDAASPDRPAAWDVPPDGTYSRSDGHVSSSHVGSPLVAGIPFGTCAIHAARWASQQKIVVDPAVPYILEYWVKTSHRPPDFHALVVGTVDFYDAAGKFLSGAAVERDAPLSDDWEQARFKFGPAGIPWPAETASVVVGFGGGGWTESCEVGLVYGEQAFDDLSFLPEGVSLPPTGSGVRDSRTGPSWIVVSIAMLGAALFVGAVRMTRKSKRCP